MAIQDTGQGIDPTRLDGIFTSFTTTKPQGPALGSPICGVVIQQHGGELAASSDGASGAHFEFVLPMMNVESAPAVRRQAEQDWS